MRERESEERKKGRVLCEPIVKKKKKNAFLLVSSPSSLSSFQTAFNDARSPTLTSCLISFSCRRVAPELEKAPLTWHEKRNHRCSHG